MKTLATRTILILSLVGGLMPRAHAQGGVPLWTNRYNRPGNGYDQAYAIAVDSSGNVFVTGSSTASAGDSDYATIKYSNTGTPIWTNYYNGPAKIDDAAYAIAVDSSGNVFVTGYSAGSGTGRDYAKIKYSNAGLPLWTNRYNGPGNGPDQASAIAVDHSGNAIVTGYSYDTAGSGYATIKYSAAGASLWTKRYTGPGNNDQATAIAVDKSGNVFVTGYSTGSTSNSDYATIAYSGAGIPLWTNRYNGPGNGDDVARAITVDSSGNVFVTGYSTSSAGNSDYATIAYSNAGLPLWTNYYNGPGNNFDGASAIAVDSSGNVFVTGSSTGTDDGHDYTTIKYSGAGAPLWTNRYSGPLNGGYDDATALAVDAGGNVIVTGSSTTNAVTIAYSGAGLPLWTNRYNAGPGTLNNPTAIAVDSSGNVFVTGYSGSGNQDYATLKYSSSISTPPHLDFQKLNNQLVLSWTNTAFSLQSAPNVSGTFTNIPDAASPYTNSTIGMQQYFRLSH